MLRVRGVTKSFPAKPEAVTALRGVDLEVARGSFTAVLGASGCGKTTLLRILAGFERPDAGEVHLDGKLVAGGSTYVPPEQRSVGIVAQDGALFPHLDVFSNIAYGLDGGWSLIHGSKRRAERSKRVGELLELVGLPGYATRRPDELSGGQQQRVALARALAPQPSVILLDEPFSALDTGLRVEVREDVRDVLRRLDTTVVLVTHDQGEALSLADHVAIMRQGRVVQSGSPTEVYLSPADTEVAAFLGDAVILHGVVVQSGPLAPAEFVNAVGGKDSQPAIVATGGTGGGVVAAALVSTWLRCPLGLIECRDLNGCRVGDECTLMLRPEQLEIADSGMPARVLSTSFYGHDGVIRLEVEGLDAAVTVRSHGGPLPNIGDEVMVRVAPGSLAHLSN